MQKSKIIPLCILVASLRSKHGITELPLRTGLIYSLGKLIAYLRICEAHMIPTLNGSSADSGSTASDVIEICDGIIFDFYTGLSHMCIVWYFVGCC